MNLRLITAFSSRENQLYSLLNPVPPSFLVSSGNGTMHLATENIVSEGDVLFAHASTEISVTAEPELHLYRAGINSRVF